MMSKKKVRKAMKKKATRKRKAMRRRRMTMTKHKIHPRQQKLERRVKRQSLLVSLPSKARAK